MEEKMKFFLILIFLFSTPTWGQAPVKIEYKDLSSLILKCDLSNVKKNGRAYNNVTYQNNCSNNYIKNLYFFKGYKSYLTNQNTLVGIASNYKKKTQLYRIGKTHRNRPILALLITDQSVSDKVYRPSIFINCAHHANELISTEFCYKIISELLKEEKNQYLKKYRFWAVPIVNVDGSENHWDFTRSSGRKNGRKTRDGAWDKYNGVDINRNYPFKWGETSKWTSSNPSSVYYMGPKAASEPEIQAVMSLSKKEKFVLSLTFHTAATKILTPYTIPGAKNPTPEIARKYADVLAQFAETGRSDRPKYKVAKNLYAVSGTDQDWHFFHNGTIALLVEGPYYHTSINYKGAKNVISKFIPGLWRWIEYFENSPKLQIRTLDRNKKPIKTLAEIEDWSYFQGEEFYTDDKYGVHLFPLTKTGLLNLKVTRNPGTEFEKIEKRSINIKGGFNKIDIIF
jgi:hypothetical protein